MRQKPSIGIPIQIVFMTIALAIAFWPQAARAATIYVARTNAECTVFAPDPCYTTIPSAITAAVDGDLINIQNGTYTYSDTITVDKNVSLQGVETAQTKISRGGSGTILSLTSVSGISIKNLTFISASLGISLTNSSSIDINNNVFNVGTSGTAISIDSTSSAEVINNTFYQNGTAVSSSQTTTIINNIFNSNFIAISITDDSGIRTNCFYANTSDGSVGADTGNTNVYDDPLFVSTSNDDFHLQSGSLCIDAGDAIGGNDSIDSSTPDIGAYGGSLADTIPFPVSGLSATVSGSGPYTITLSWAANTCYRIGGYNVYYDTTSGSYANSALGITGTSTDIAGIAPSPPAPTGPTILTHTIASKTFELSWDASGVSGATGYVVRYDTVSPPTAVSEDAGNSTSYELTGLSNGTDYYVVVVPYAQETYYLAVKTYYGSDPNTTTLISEYSAEESTPVGDPVYGTASNEIFDYPEDIVPYPNLPNEGCFIATAAYGYYSAPQVQTLRDFRDQYLLANAPGRAFVKWYYTYGPVGARFINEHPWLKPVVRVGLLPAVGAATFMTRTTMPAKMAIVIFTVLMLSLIVQRRRHRKSSQHEASTAEQ